MQHERYVGFEIKALSNLLRRRLMSTAEHPQGMLTEIEGVLIGYLCHNKKQEIYQKDLESEFGITRSTASRVLRLMEQKGLVERQSVPQDARLKKLVLTERSRRLVQEMCQTGMTIDTRLLRGFSPDEVQTLYGFLDRMFRNLE